MAEGCTPIVVRCGVRWGPRVRSSRSSAPARPRRPPEPDSRLAPYPYYRGPLLARSTQDFILALFFRVALWNHVFFDMVYAPTHVRYTYIHQLPNRTRDADARSTSTPRRTARHRDNARDPRTQSHTPQRDGTTYTASPAMSAGALGATSPATPPQPRPVPRACARARAASPVHGPTPLLGQQRALGASRLNMHARAWALIRRL